jgi:pentose-5-phosphate-3-epimerase
MNTLIEAISYGEGGYWGDKGKYMVRAKIDEFPTTVEVEIGTDRIVKTEFQITVNGHIIPKNIQQSAAQGSTKAITGTKVVIGESIVKNINSVDDNLDSSTINT